MMSKVFWDENEVRYRFVKKNSPEKSLNTFIIPGGPGMDSSYLVELASVLEIPGNIWLIDFPGNGSNFPDFRNFDAWFDFLVETVEKNFANVVILGHSFGAVLPLICNAPLLPPTFDDLLKGLILINPSPIDWRASLKNIAKEKNLSNIEAYLRAYKDNPCEETFRAFAPYFFTSGKMEEGMRLIKNLPINFHAFDWWDQELQNYRETWIPEKVPTLIIEGMEDYIAQPKLVAEDQRFDRDNITQIKIEGASHFCWLEKPEEVRKQIENFYKNLAIKS